MINRWFTGGEFRFLSWDFRNFSRGVVSYTNDIKVRVLGVDSRLLASGGAVQAKVAEQMAKGVSDLYGTQYALATTGVAGPGPADGKKQGTVFIAVKTPDSLKAVQYQFHGNREQIRMQSAEAAILLLLSEITAIKQEL
ncbi:CinA family protein [Arcanobacterium hippocoleae]